MARHVRKPNYAPLKRALAVGGVLLCAAVLAMLVWGAIRVLPTGGGVSIGGGTSTTASYGTTTSGSTAVSTATGSSSLTENSTATSQSEDTDTAGSTSTSGTVAGSTTSTIRPTSTSTATNTTTATASTSTATNTTATTASTTTTQTIVTQNGLRGVWVSYIELASWMSGTEANAKANIDKLMDDCVTLGLNTVFFHTRANSDAYYASQYYTPAYWVEPLLRAGFDPLAYAVKEAHAHGIELHAWVNPYRIGTNASNAQNDDYFALGSSYYYLPSSEAVQTLILNGIRELLAYGVDGIHFDDYFYPDGMSDSADAAHYAAYQQSGGTLSRGDWRRAQVTGLLRQVYAAAHAAGAVFGVAPMADIAGNYSLKFADVEGWMQASDVIDYICPQLYYGFENSGKPFAQTAETWMAMPRHSSVKLYVGLGLYKAGISEDTWAGSGKYEWVNGGDIFARQVKLLKEKNVGFVLYSYAYLSPSYAASVIDGDAAVTTREIENLLTALRS